MMSEFETSESLIETPDSNATSGWDLDRWCKNKEILLFWNIKIMQAV